MLKSVKILHALVDKEIEGGLDSKKVSVVNTPVVYPFAKLLTMIASLRKFWVLTDHLFL